MIILPQNFQNRPLSSCLSSKARLAPERRRGQAMVEFAMVLPLLLGLTMGMIQYGVIYNTALAVTNISREGARGAAVDILDQTPDAQGNGKKKGRQRVKARMERATKGTQIKASDLVIDVTPDPEQNEAVTANGDVTVTVTYPMKKKLFLPSKFFGITIFAENFTAQTTMRVE